MRLLQRNLSRAFNKWLSEVRVTAIARSIAAKWVHKHLWRAYRSWQVMCAQFRWALQHWVCRAMYRSWFKWVRFLLNKERITQLGHHAVLQWKHSAPARAWRSWKFLCRQVHAAKRAATHWMAQSVLCSLRMWRHICKQRDRQRRLVRKSLRQWCKWELWQSLGRWMDWLDERSCSKRLLLRAAGHWHKLRIAAAWNKWRQVNKFDRFLLHRELTACVTGLSLYTSTQGRKNGA